MANNGGNKRGLRRIVDMAIHPKPDIYKPPDVPPADEYISPITMDDDNKLVLRQRIYKGKVVDFAIQQLVRSGDAWVEVARIDCCHSEVHRHQFVRNGEDRRTIIRPIPRQGWDVVDDAFTGCLDLMEDEWEANVRRWSGDV